MDIPLAEERLRYFLDELNSASSQVLAIQNFLIESIWQLERIGCMIQKMAV